MTSQTVTTNTQAKKPKEKPNMNYLRDKHAEIVPGIFKYFEAPGGTLSFTFREFKGDKPVRYDLTDGEVYRIPYGVAKHLNKNGWYPEYNFVPGDKSIQLGAAVAGFANNAFQKVTRKVHRYAFQSLEFTDIEDIPNSVSSIVAVESV